jgi:cell division protein FtsW
MLKAWVDRNLKGDPVIWFIVFALSIISILVVYSATGTLAYKKMQGDTEFYLIRHTFLVIFCFFAMWIAHKIDYKYYSGLSKIALIASVPLLLFAYFFGANINDASRWIIIPVINQSFQPSDLAKLALIANLASMLSKRQQKIEDIKESLIPMLIWCGVICGMIAMTNFSTAILLFSTCMLLMFIGRVPVKYLLMLALIGLLFGAGAAKVGQRFDTAMSRIEAFLDPTEVPFQAEQSYIAISTGGLFGKGPGNSDQRNFLPSAYADFIYAILIEEYGMIGGVSVLFLYLALLYRGMLAAARSNNAFGGLLSAGLSFSLALQALINMAVVVGIVPVTGQPLPLLSMGGTSLLFTGLSFGIILSVSRGAAEENSNSLDYKNVPK